MKKNTITLLRLLKSRSDIGFLTRQGLTYSQISLLFSEALANKLIISKIGTDGRQRFVVTEEGEKLCSARERIGPEAKATTQWITPDQKHWRQKIEVDEIFLPGIIDAFSLRPDTRPK